MNGKPDVSVAVGTLVPRVRGHAGRVTLPIAAVAGRPPYQEQI